MSMSTILKEMGILQKKTKMLVYSFKKVGSRGSNF